MGKSRVLWVALAAVALLSLAACALGKPMPVPTVSGSSTASGLPTGSASPTPTAPPIPKLHPGGTAAANQQFFDYVNGTFVTQFGWLTVRPS